LEAVFSQVAKNYKVSRQIVGGVFLMFWPKIKDEKLIRQFAEDTLIFSCIFFLLLSLCK
jgi:hypothetical protein